VWALLVAARRGDVVGRQRADRRAALGEPRRPSGEAELAPPTPGRRTPHDSVADLPAGHLPRADVGGLAAAAGANAGNFAQATSPNTTVTQIPGQPSNDNSEVNATGAATNQGTSFAAAGPGAPGAFGSVNASNSANPQVFGGGPIVGVASTSKDKTIRIFNKKQHYNEWQFVYDPTTDRGGLLTTPNQPSLQGATTIQGTQGTLGAPGTTTGTPGQPGGFGNQPSQPNQPGLQAPQMPPEQP